MSQTYYIGADIRLTGSFVDINNNPIAPTAVVCRVVDPTGAEWLPEVVTDGTGLYHADFTPMVAGQHFYRFQSTGNGQGANQSGFVVVGGVF